MFPLQASVDVFLNVSCTSTEQECMLLQPDVEVDDKKKTTSQQTAAREEFARSAQERHCEQRFGILMHAEGRGGVCV